MTSLIVIPTHRSGVALLDNLLQSFAGYDKYPMMIVISGYRPKDRKIFLDIKTKFAHLPITWERIETNSFELGGLYTAQQKSNYDELLLLSHSCEIVNTEIFDIAFEKYRGRSVAFSLQIGNWKYAQGENEQLTLRHLDRKINRHLVELGEIKFWQAHIGKYRRAILDQMNLLDYLPTNMIEAISKSELLFTSRYHTADPSTVVLFPEWTDGTLFEEKCGATRLKIMNEYIIKWKTHWNTNMVFDEMLRQEPGYVVKDFLRRKFPTIYSRLKAIGKTTL